MMPAFVPDSTTYRPSSPWLTLPLALLSFGLWPLWRWREQWLHFVALDRSHCIRVGRLRLQKATANERPRVLQACRQLGGLPVLLAGWLLALVASACILAVSFLTSDSADRFWQGTYTLASIHGFSLHWCWVLAVSFGYFCHWFSVRRYLFARRVLDETMMPPADLGPPGVAWVVVAVILCALGAWWAIPMALAGSLQRRHSVLRYVPPASGVRTCRTTGCGRALPASALYCPRCGGTTA